MSEYLYTDLPRYVKTTPRENFADSVVKSGSVLLFSEDGEKLVAKLPDGTFKEIGGSGEYYRCASVDTSTKTWTGYKAVLNDGVYTFEDTVTQGLAYTSVMPQVGNIYSADAMARVAYLYDGIPSEGLIFYAPLKESFESSAGTLYADLCLELSNATFENNHVEFPSVQNYAFYKDVAENMMNPLTVSYWGRSDGTSVYVKVSRTLSNTDTGDNGDILVTISNGTFTITEAYVKNMLETETQTNDALHHFCYVHTDSTVKAYKDGVLLDQAESTLQYTTGRSHIVIASRGNGAMAGVRVYNRALDASEVSVLANELSF